MIAKHKHLILSIIVVLIIIFLGRNLNPFNRNFFVAHDQTQAARISEFALNLTNGKVPPRISPHMSYGMGYPIFNYYAPVAYWITSAIHLAGIPIIQSLKISYLLALVTGFMGMVLFLKKYFSPWQGVIGGLLYVASPFVAVDIFVRGNLAEVWFFALFPLTLALLSKTNKKQFFITALVVSLLFSVHNIFSLLSVGILMVYAILLKNKYAALSILAGLMLAAYFLIPALVELPLIHAQDVATITNYQDHFVCPMQLWYSPWGFGGSTVGCANDGMSFMVGKWHLIVGLGGLVLLIWNIISKRTIKHRGLLISMAFLLVGSVFLTTTYSAIIWRMLERILALFQFPWRFLLFVVFGLSFFGAYAISQGEKWLPRRARIPTILFLGIGILILNSKFFYGKNISNAQYRTQFISSEYIDDIAAFQVAEYLPISAKYDTWRGLENKKELSRYGIPAEHAQMFDRIVIQKAGEDVLLNIHNANYWSITSNGVQLAPVSYDTLGRPIIAKTDNERKIQITYSQTTLEKWANVMSLAASIILFIYSYLWNPRKKII